MRFQIGMMLCWIVFGTLSALAGGGITITEAISHPDRFEGDAKHDERRKPAAFLAFFDVKPGMTVLDMFAGDGYYTELLSRIVGDDGKVYIHNNQAYLNFVKDRLPKRLAEKRLANVVRKDGELNDLRLPEGELDMVMMALVWHDTMYADEANGWPAIDGDAVLARVYRWLKPGGIIALSDNSAEAGSKDRDVKSMHRVDEAFLIAQFEKAGFVVDGKSDILRHPSDDRTKLVFDKSIYGKHDRFVIRFKKPR